MPIPPWADRRTGIEGAEFERVVAEILQELSKSLQNCRIENQELIKAADGQYRIDVTVRFDQLGAQFLVLVECKDHSRPVEREDVQVLADKVRAAGAQKGMLFSTNGFQRGAVEYARNHGIALVRVIEGALTYETRALPVDGQRPGPPPWANIPPFVGQLISLADNGNVCTALVDRGRTEPLKEFLEST